ncbi:MAG: hypothetical protein GY940_37345 [bacterium]|nr:hypothetical protein [bacterium]
MNEVPGFNKCDWPLRPVPVKIWDGCIFIHYFTVFPNMLLSLHPDYVLIHQFVPVAADRSKVVCDWLFHPDAMAKPGFDPSDAVEFWNLTNRQDWMVSELSQEGISSRSYTPGPCSELESMIAAWDKHYLSKVE